MRMLCNNMASKSCSYEENYSEDVTGRLFTEFSRLKGAVYLDHTAATLYAESQIKSVHEDLLRNVYGNPHSLSLSSKLTHDVIDSVRYRILNHFHNPEEYSVIFTSGATDALKLVVESFDWEGSSNIPKLPKEFSISGSSENNVIDPESKESKQGKAVGNFVYLNESHTSVIGMREIAAANGATVKSISNSKLQKCLSQNLRNRSNSEASNSLFVYPAQCNFSGVKYPLKWTELSKGGALNCCFPGEPTNWYCMLDAATYVSTNDLNLSEVKPDFVCISFYKIFGYPTGLGALLIKNSAGHVLKKRYFGGGSVSLSLSNKKFHVNKQGLERFEDGTISFLSILSLHHGFNMLDKLVGSMTNVAIHTFNLAKYFYDTLISMNHYNGKPVAKIYCDTNYENVDIQGNIVNFNLLRANGSYVGYAEVLQLANLNNIHIRTGCFCNSGACQRHLCLSDQELMDNFEAGHVCGDTMDLINGKPTGSVRVSFGYMSTKKDADAMLTLIRECFMENESETSEQSKDKSLSQPPGVGSDTKLSQNLRAVNMDEIRILNDITVSYVYLSHMFLYPIKSCGAFEVKRWPIGPRGLLHDRQWMIVAENGVCVTQKLAPTLCMIQPTIDLKNELLHLNYPGMQQISVTLSADSITSTSNLTICLSKVCGNKVQAVDCGDAVAEWLTTAIQNPSLGKLRLHSQYCSSDEITKIKHNNNSSGQMKARSLSNQAQFLLLNNASVQWLLENVGKGMEDSSFDEEQMISRFRCNFVVTGAPRLSENNWNGVTIGNVAFQSQGPCTRCQIICIDQATGRKTKEPLMTLVRLFEGKMKFGIYLSSDDSLQNNLTISVGDLVTSTKTFE